MVYSSKEIGIYKHFRLKIMTNDTNAKIRYLGYLSNDPEEAPTMLDEDNLEGLKTKIDNYFKQKGVSRK